MVTIAVCRCFNEVNSLLWLHSQRKRGLRCTGTQALLEMSQNIITSHKTATLCSLGDVQQLLVLLMFEVEDETLNPSQEFCLRHLANCKETSKLGLVRYPPIKVVVQLTNNVYTYYIICQFSSTCLPGNYTLKPLHNLKKSSNKTLEFTYYMKTFKLNVQMA